MDTSASDNQVPETHTPRDEMKESAELELELYQSIEAYDWENDSVYQRALERMSKTTELEPNELELRAKCFYWARKFKTDIDFPKYRSWKIAQNPETHALSSHDSINSLTMDLSQSNIADNAPSNNTSPASDSHEKETSFEEPPAPYPQNFAEVAELITSGRGHLLPGTKQIAPIVLADKITAPTKELRRKPWEKDDTELKVGGMFGDRRDIFIKQEWDWWIC